ncbi:MAG: hypothetical protein AAF267_18355, partial [Deinococcota bacterium]
SRFTILQLAGIIMIDNASGHELSISLHGDRKLNPALADMLADEFQAMGCYETIMRYTRSTDVNT